MQDKQQAATSSYVSELQLHSVLGVGGFSKVYAGTWMGARTAIKVGRLHRQTPLSQITCAPLLAWLPLYHCVLGWLLIRVAEQWLPASAFMLVADAVGSRSGRLLTRLRWYVS
jgi:hypothetical protein